jgi:formylglycine-generating enzyme required for sulfatase activity
MKLVTPIAIVLVLAGVVWFWMLPSGLGAEFEPMGDDVGVHGLPVRIRHVPTGIVLVLIPPGEFVMGTPPEEVDHDEDEPLHRVTIDRAFYLGETEVTVAQWKALMVDDPLDEDHAQPDYPMNDVTWHRAKEFVNLLNARGEGGWRLPAEAEWEYACRADTTTAFSFGDNITTDQANYLSEYPYADAPKRESRKQPVPVRSLPPNAFGLYEMHGNVWEWCEDLYFVDPRSTKGASDPGAPRVIRGGSFESPAGLLRSGYRDGYPPSSSGPKYGMRLAKTIP